MKFFIQNLNLTFNLIIFLNQIYKYYYQFFNLFNHYFQKKFKFMNMIILIEIKDKLSLKKIYLIIHII